MYNIITYHYNKQDVVVLSSRVLSLAYDRREPTDGAERKLI
jgi:hypothetical protein